MEWRRLLRVLHRDIGYVCFGLTIAYALSGVLLNHLHDWNSNYRVERASRGIVPYRDPSSFRDADVPSLLDGIGEREKPTGVFRPSPGIVRIFFEGGRVVTADLVTGKVEGEVAVRRPVLARLNALHLNRAGNAWTVLSDLYAVALAFMAVSGILILRDRTGLSGRGWRLAALGVAVPALILLAFALL